MTTAVAPRPYDVEAASPGFRDLLQVYARKSAEVRSARPCRLDIAYGPGAAERLDVFMADAPDAPAVVFLHGGGWRASSKEDRSFPAEVFCPAGATWISMEYPLAPVATLDEMVASVRRGIAWVHAHGQEIGIDPDRIHLCGNSAGGHLVGMALGTDWARHGGLPQDVIKGATTVSGVFQMLPLMASGANGWLRMDVEAAVRNSPIFNLPGAGCPLLCAVGADEPPEFLEQSEAFVAVWRARGYEGTFLRVPGRNHFSVIGDLGNRDSALVRGMFAQIGLAA